MRRYAQRSHDLLRTGQRYNQRRRVRQCIGAGSRRFSVVRYPLSNDLVNWLFDDLGPLAKAERQFTQWLTEKEHDFTIEDFFELPPGGPHQKIRSSKLAQLPGHPKQLCSPPFLLLRSSQLGLKTTG